MPSQAENVAPPTPNNESPNRHNLYILMSVDLPAYSSPKTWIVYLLSVTIVNLHLSTRKLKLNEELKNFLIYENLMPFAISVENVTKSFEESRIIDDVSFNLAPGTSSVIVGPAASGKSLLLKCILGLIPIDSGNISINGLKGINRLKETNNIGVMFQENALFDSLTVWENIAFRLINQKRISEKTAKSIAREKLSQVHLTNDSFYKYPAELSGGMQKRVSLARALVTDPQILLIDEPTAGLDPILTTVICNLIAAHKSKFGATILAVTSDMRVAREKYDQILYLKNGTIEWAGTLESLQQTGTKPVKEFILE